MPLAIDPNIALAYKGFDGPDPVAIARQQADTNLTNLQATGQQLTNIHTAAQIAATQRLNQIFAGLFSSSAAGSGPNTNAQGGGAGAAAANGVAPPLASGASVQGSGPNSGTVLTRDPSGLIVRQGADQQAPSSGASAVPGQASLGTIGTPQPTAAPQQSGSSSSNPYESVDWSKLPGALAQGGLGSFIPSIMKGVTEYQTGITDLKKKKTDLADAQSDAAGSFGNAVQQAKYSPQLFLTLGLHALQSGAVDQADVAPMLQQVFQSLHDDPSGQQATALTKQFTENMIAGSNKQQTLATQATTAQGNLLRGQAASQQATRAQGIADLKSAAAAMLSAPPQDQAAYGAYLDQQSHGVAKQMEAAVPVASYDPKTSPQKLGRMGMSGAEVLADQRATNHQAAEEQHWSDETDIAKLRIKYENSMLALGQRRSDLSDSREDRANQAQADGLVEQEAALNKSRLQLGAALKGNYFVDPKGKQLPYAADDQGEQREDMQARYNEATDQLTKVIQQKNETFLRMGKTPSVSTQQATSQLKAGNSGTVKQTVKPAAAPAPPPAAPAAPTQGSAADPWVKVRVPGGFISGKQSDVQRELSQRGLNLVHAATQ